MQNHGGYYASDYEWPVRVHEVSPVNSYDESVIAYESSVHMADGSVRQLISYFETVDEPTVVLFFSDHEPAFQANSTQAGLPTRTISIWKPPRNSINPFFIWGNYDLNTESSQKEFGGFAELPVHCVVPNGGDTTFAIPGILGGSSHRTPSNYGSLLHYRIRRQGRHDAFGVYRFDP